MSAREHLRGVPELRKLRGRRPAVIVLMQDPSPYEAVGDELDDLRAELVVERTPGPLSERLGRPSVTVCDRYLDVELAEERPDPEEVVETVRAAEWRCEECTQADVDTWQFFEQGRRGA